MSKEGGPAQSPIYDILDMIGKGVTIRDEILEEARISLLNGNPQPNLDSMEEMARFFKAVDGIEIEEVPTILEFPQIDRQRGGQVKIELGNKAEERVLSIILQFDIVWYVEKTAKELDDEGVDLIIHFLPTIGLIDAGVQVKSSKTGVDKFLRKQNLGELVEKYNLFMVNANPKKEDHEIYMEIYNIFNQKLKSLQAQDERLTNIA